MPSVLITRPQAAAEYLASELQRLGYASVIAPLLRIEPTHTPRPPEPVQAVMITSGNAIEALDVRENADLFEKPCFCVGPRTAARARDAGFHHVYNVLTDGEELAQFISLSLPDKRRPLLHIAGRDIDSGARNELQKLGYRTIGWPVYAAIPVAAFTAATQAQIEQRRLDAVVVYSPRTAGVLAALLSQGSLEACCPGVAAICLSATVADVLKPFPWRTLVAAPVPAEDALIACLRKACPIA